MYKNTGRKINTGNTKIKYLAIIFLFLLFVAGSIIGAVIEVKIDNEMRAQVLDLISDTVYEGDSTRERPDIMKASIKSNLNLLIIMAASGISIILFPMSILVILYKGAALGFTAALIMEGGGGLAILKAVFALLPQNIVFIPMFIIFSYLTICFAISVIRCKNRKHRKKIYLQWIKLYLIVLVICLAVLLVGGLIEAFVNPFFINLLRI